MCQSSRAIIFRFNSKTQRQMFFVTLRLPCLCPSKGHKHGVSIQSSINLGNTLVQTAREWKTAETWFLGRLCIYQSSIVPRFLTLFIKWLRFLVWSHDWWKPRIRWASRAFLTDSRLLRMSSIGVRRTSLIKRPAWLKWSDTGVVVLSCRWFRIERRCSQSAHCVGVWSLRCICSEVRL